MTDDLTEHLNSLAREDCYRVDAVLKEGSFETTQRVYFVGSNGAELGPYVRKYLGGGEGVGGAYDRIFQAQREGRRFRYLPRIVECFDAGDRHVVVMEHVPGETLLDVVYRCDPSTELALDVFPRICDAVSELHVGFDPPIIHRDLKPTNIMLSSGGLSIIDFGIARSYDEGAEADTRYFGTRAYAPPEQFGFGQTDVRSDVYALGMLLYFMLTEKTPTPKAREQGFPCIGPAAVREVVVRATAFDPADRFASAAHLKQAFLQALGYGGAGAAAQPDGARTVSGRSQADGGRSAYVSPQGGEGAPLGGRPQPGEGRASSPRGVPGTAAVMVPTYGVSGADPRVLGGEPGLAGTPGRTADDGAGAAVRAPSGASAALKGLLAKVPLALGAVWDVLLGLFFLLTVLGAVLQTVDPSRGSAQYAAAPLWLRAVSYGSLALLIVAPVLYSVADRRPIRRIVPRLAGVSLGRDLVACLVVFLVGMFVFILTGQLFPPMQ